MITRGDKGDAVKAENKEKQRGCIYYSTKGTD
jgi:hypothetical protein